MPQAKILIVDDEQFIIDSLTAYLESENMMVTSLKKGSDVISCLNENTYDMVLLDLILKDVDGLDVLKDIKKEFPRQQVIVLSAKKELHDKVLGLGLGADDYITKPFQPPELIARIKAHIRTAKNHSNNETANKHIINYHELQFDLDSMQLMKAEKTIFLNARLFKLLEFFHKNAGRAVSKEMIYNHLWNDKYFDDNTIKVYVRKLRLLIEDDPENPKYLHTVRGMGYCFSYKE